MVEKHADLRSETVRRNGGHVVAAHYRRSGQAICLADRHLCRESTDRRGYRCDRHRRQVRTHEISRENQDGTRLVETRNVDGGGGGGAGGGAAGVATPPARAA